LLLINQGNSEIFFNISRKSEINSAMIANDLQDTAREFLDRPALASGRCRPAPAIAPVDKEKAPRFRTGPLVSAGTGPGRYH